MNNTIYQPIAQCLTVLALTLSYPIWAQGALHSEMQAYLVLTNDDGTEALQAATAAAPGQVIEYRSVYSNHGDSTVSGLVAIGPMPPGTRYVAGSATASVAHVLEVSIDGGSSWHREPLMRQVILPDGSRKEEVVPAQEYSHVRWQARQALASDERQEYRYRVAVDAAAQSAR